MTLFPQQVAEGFLRCLQAPGKREAVAKRRVMKKVFFMSIRSDFLVVDRHPVREATGLPITGRLESSFKKGTKKRPPREAVVSLKSI